MMHLGVNALFLIPGEVGGTQTYFVETLRELLPMLPCRCTVFTNTENDGFLREALGCAAAPRGLDFDCLGFAARNRYSRIVREQVQLPRRVARAGCDLLWSPGYTAPRFCRARQVVTIHDMQYRRFREDLSPVAWLATHILVTSAARHCDGIIAVSEFAKSEISALAKVPPGKIAVTLEGADQKAPPPEEVAGADGRPPYILCVAASYPHKNLPGLVRAFGLVARDIPHRLVIAGGRGLAEGELMEAIASSPAGGRIDRKGWIGGGELAALYAGADLFVMPSRYEGFGIPVIEAQKAGVPVLATKFASLPEVCGDGALYIGGDGDEAMAEAIRSALSLGAAERGALVERGRANAMRFTWRGCAGATLRALERFSKPGSSAT